MASPSPGSGSDVRADADRRPSPAQVDIVDYWRLLELFNPQTVKAPDPGNATEPVLEWSPDRPPPWVRPRQAGTFRGKPQEWRYTVYLGVYAIEALYDHLHRVFPRDEDAYDERPGGSSACACLQVSADGRMIADSAVLSSALWAIGRTTSPGAGVPGWSLGFEEAAQRLLTAFAQRLAPVPDEAAGQDAEAVPPVLDGALLSDLVRIAHTVAGVSGFDGVATHQARITCTRVPVGASPEPSQQQSDFLNSFYLDDLLTVAGSSWGAALHEYLTPADRLPVAARIDVRSTPEAVVAGTRVERLPLGRWPSGPGVHLSTSQQFAVNEAFGGLGTSCTVMGVNGPPGTGKTTLIRDVLAGNVVARAQVLSRFATAGSVLAGQTHTWKTGTFTHRLRTLRPDVTGFEMLLASSNNTAVQNVTDELPRRASIHDPQARADYFGDLAAEIARRQHAGQGRDVDAWGLVSARLGRRSNRSQFSSAFWFGSGAQDAPHDPAAGTVHGFWRLLKNWRADPSTRPDWDEAKRAFSEALARVDELTGACRRAQDRLAQHQSLRADLAAATTRLAAIDAHLQTSDARRAAAQEAVRTADAALAEPAARYERHLSSRPRWLETLLDREAIRTWRGVLASREEDVSVAQARAGAARRHLEELDASTSTYAQERLSCDASIRDLRGRVASLGRRIHEDAATWGDAYPDPGWLDDERSRELHAPWLDDPLDDARSHLFLMALKLHEAFLAGADIGRDLNAAFDVVTGAAPHGLVGAARQAAWQLVFLVVPLVSTTFASMGRMAHGVGPGTFGWLLIDEAGQATPQSAVGAIWRARKVLAVGDPMQLTPVVTVPARAQHDLARGFSLTDEWAPSTTSVQLLTDRISRYGTTFTNGPEPMWVGAPLRVHRRCASPMFDISNQIAYDGMMINGISARTDAVPQAPSSRWVDVAAGEPGSHLQRAEIRALRGLLDALGRIGVAGSDVIVISPFRAVATALGQVRSEHPGIVAGTVHTAQGKEADVVILVLGGDPRRPGAKVWASTRPNLINVAVSRARHRLYVIGDRQAWQRHPYVSDVARAMDVETVESWTHSPPDE